MNRRLQILRHAIRLKSFRGSFRSWLLTCLGPTTPTLANRVIDSISTQDGFRVLSLRGEPGTLYIDENLADEMLLQTIVEQMYHWHWHQYKIPQTTVTEQDVVFDCDSAEGLFVFLNKFRAKHIYAFEPLPAYIKGLEKTFARQENVTTIECALGADTGTAYVKGAGIATKTTEEPTDTPITVETIDSVSEKYSVDVTYLKADLEGYEMEMLRVLLKKFEDANPKSQ